MATTTVADGGLTIGEMHDSVVSIAEALTAAHELVGKGTQEAAVLYGRLDDRLRREYLPRFDYEVVVAVRGLAEDLGVDTESGKSGDFNIDRTPIDARDLVDLIDLALSERAAA